MSSRRQIDQQLERVQCLAGSETGWRLTEHHVAPPEFLAVSGPGGAVALKASENTMSVGAGVLAMVTLMLILTRAFKR